MKKKIAPIYANFYEDEHNRASGYVLYLAKMWIT